MLKKIMSCIMAVAMLLSVCTVSFAADLSKTESLLIYGLDAVVTKTADGTVIKTADNKLTGTSPSVLDANGLYQQNNKRLGVQTPTAALNDGSTPVKVAITFNVAQAGYYDYTFNMSAKNTSIKWLSAVNCGFDGATPVDSSELVSAGGAMAASYLTLFNSKTAIYLTQGSHTVNFLPVSAEDANNARVYFRLESVQFTASQSADIPEISAQEQTQILGNSSIIMTNDGTNQIIDPTSNDYSVSLSGTPATRVSCMTPAEKGNTPVKLQIPFNIVEEGSYDFTFWVSATVYNNTFLSKFQYKFDDGDYVTVTDTNASLESPAINWYKLKLKKHTAFSVGEHNLTIVPIVNEKNQDRLYFILREILVDKYVEDFSDVTTGTTVLNASENALVYDTASNEVIESGADDAVTYGTTDIGINKKEIEDLTATPYEIQTNFEVVHAGWYSILLTLGAGVKPNDAAWLSRINYRFDEETEPTALSEDTANIIINQAEPASRGQYQLKAKKYFTVGNHSLHMIPTVCDNGQLYVKYTSAAFTMMTDASGITASLDNKIVYSGTAPKAISITDSLGQTVTADNTLMRTFVSDNESVATVDGEGVITFNNVGKANIEVCVSTLRNDKSGQQASVTDSFSVFVIDEEGIYVDNASLNGTTISADIKSVVDYQGGAKFIIGVYNVEDNIITSLNKCTIVDIPAIAKDASYPISESVAEITAESKIRVFLWNSMDQMIPLFEKIEIQ